MNASPDCPHEVRAHARYELRFQSLFDDGRGYAFDCDADGRVDIGTLTESGRCHYLQACARVGRDFATPALRTLH
jgi:hypothetical protein